MNRTSVATSSMSLPRLTDAQPARSEARHLEAVQAAPLEVTVQETMHRLPAFTRMSVCPCADCTDARKQAYDLARQTCDPLYHHNGESLRDAREELILERLDVTAKLFLVLIFIAFLCMFL